ncbi:hypothetical protein BDN72DRAFT_905544 [Pluteus cervinus]|uniref:Uncharacterized protein n=1 Tax=Pluteus cervinus TaxID=181527 RepID=A0ACD3A2B3_9AGAR|nr:hypothetical protein BDN72DRAFT_905544 [Pluteus cervinus]
MKNGVRTRVLLTAGKQQARRDKATAQRRAEIEAMEEPARNAARMMDVDSGFGGDDVDAAAFILPPGKAGLDPSHEGGECADIQAMLDTVQARTRAPDPRTRRDRGENEQHYWGLQSERLADAYLEFSHRHPCHLPQDFPPPIQQDSDSASGDTLGTLDFWDVSGQKNMSVALQAGHEYLNESLLQFGYLASSPLRPTTAFSIQALKLYRQAHRTCPRFSIEAYCRTLCHVLNIPFPTYLPVQFSHSYDTYLLINRIVDRRVDAALGRNEPNWHIKNSCPACFYALEDEPALKFSALVSMDGNNSLRRINASMHGQRRVDHLDTRTINSDWWLTAGDVDKFKHEVQSSPDVGGDIPNDHNNKESVDDEAQNGEPLSKCRDRWKNAGPEERKRMFALFEETGVFIASCRHRLVVAGCDMIKSGEQYKYPFAVVDKLISVFGSRIGCAYDIGCEFSKSLANSSLAGVATTNRFRLMCGAFHGWAHNRGCQLDFHPLYLPGAGNFDGEGCEHIFSSSNDLARATRHSTKFHRRQAIEEHFNFWNQDKYSLLSTYFTNHYREAQRRIRAYSLELTQLNVKLKLTAADLEADLVDERSYFTQLKTGISLQSNIESQYVNALVRLDTHTREWDDARANANMALSGPGLTNPVAAAHGAQMIVDAAYQNLQFTQMNLVFLETSLNIQRRWTPEHLDYKRYHQENIATSYHKAVNELERLVVLRFSELAKLSVGGLGYKLRRQILKSMTKRSKTIQKCITRYNKEAARLVPPREMVTWKQIADINFLGNFDILRDVGLNFEVQPWAQSKRRNAATAYFKIRRSQEEIIRLNVEVRRLRTWIADEDSATRAAIAKLDATNPILASELSHRWALRSRVNRVHIEQLDKLAKTPGFTGSSTTGVRRAQAMPQSEAPDDGVPFTIPIPIPLTVPSTSPHSNNLQNNTGTPRLEIEQDDGGDQDEWQDCEDIMDDGDGEAMDKLTDFLLGISV